VAENAQNTSINSDDNFSSEAFATVGAIIERYKSKQGSLIHVLEEIQEAIGYLPKSIQQKAAYGLSIPLSEVHGVVTFYSFFTMMPRGRHTIRCCLGTACYVRGGKKILDKLCQTLKVSPGEPTENLRFSLETMRCLGACGLAPVMMVDEDTYRQTKPTKVFDILENYKQANDSCIKFKKQPNYLERSKISIAATGYSGNC
jgi:NADH-quinone oxidoreductase subunit E/NADP-reducing hydrogenase subunit HndA